MRTYNTVTRVRVSQQVWVSADSLTDLRYEEYVLVDADADADAADDAERRLRRNMYRAFDAKVREHGVKRSRTKLHDLHPDTDSVARMLCFLATFRGVAEAAEAATDSACAHCDPDAARAVAVQLRAVLQACGRTYDASHIVV